MYIPRQLQKNERVKQLEIMMHLNCFFVVVRSYQINWKENFLLLLQVVVLTNLKKKKLKDYLHFSSAWSSQQPVLFREFDARGERKE